MKVTVEATRIGDVAREVERAARVLADLQANAIRGDGPLAKASHDYCDGLAFAYQNALEELRLVSQAVSRLSGWTGKEGE